jgi:endonuclease-8
MRVLVETDHWQAVCFLSPDVRFDDVTKGPSGVVPGASHLGPDLCRIDADLDECVRRFGELDADATVAEALLDQRVCCGVGNVFKSEVCWAVELDPFTPVVDLPSAFRRRLVEVASAQLRANLTTARRTTVPGGLAVYGRTGKACRRCGTPIRSTVHGIHARRTFWCPGCQVRPGDGQAIDQ